MNLTLHLTTNCNMNCSYCYNKKNNYSTEMDFEISRKAIELAISKTTDSEISVTFVGGEPLLKMTMIRDIVEFCKNIKSHVFLFSILTNGLLLDEEFLRFSVKNHISISLSLDGTEPAHNMFRKIGSNDSWILVMDKFKLLTSHIPDSMILITLNPETVPFLSESIKYLVKQKAKAISVSLNYMVKWNSKTLESLQIQLANIAQFYQNSLASGNTFYLNLFDSRISTLINGFCHKGRCAAGYNHLSIAPDGGLFPCIAFVEPNGFYQIGELTNGPNMTRWEEINSLNQPDMQECQDCAIQDRCFNWCACSNYLGTGRGNSISPTLCSVEKMLVPLADEIATELFEAKNRFFMDRFYNG